MKTLTRYLIVLFALTLYAPVMAGTLVLHPAGVTVIRSAAAAQPNACAILFDLSQLPDSAYIDLAELRLTLDVDSALGEAVSVFLGVATESWQANAMRTTPIVTSDSLYLAGVVEPGDDRRLEFNLTELVTLWHTGQVPNRGLVLSVPGNVLRQVALAGSTQASVTLTVYFSE